jgi:hypothetical protein
MLFDKSQIARWNKVSLRQNKYTAHIFYNNKVNSKNTATVGVMTDVYDLLFSDSIALGNGFFPMKYAKGYSSLSATLHHMAAQVFGAFSVEYRLAHSVFFT